MPKLIVVTRENEEQQLEAQTGWSVMRVIRDSGLPDILAICGGSCSCGTCHVYLDEGFLDRVPAITDAENDLLDSSSYRLPVSRLACQIPFTSDLDGMRVRIAPED